jgi:RHS repeat-associated protein
VLSVINDKKLPILGNIGSLTYFVPDEEAFNDYYPGGMLLPNRHGSSDSYRYGFNNMEKDDEIKGEGNSYDFGARMYDPRVFRWLSGDPAYNEYPSHSPYNFALNNPIINKDPDGKRVYYAAGLGGRGANENGMMKTEWDTEQNAYIQSVQNSFEGSGVYFKELQGVNGNPENSNNLGFWKQPRLTDAVFVFKYAQRPIRKKLKNTDHRIRNAVMQIVEDIRLNPPNPDEKINLVGTSMGAVTTAQAALYILENKEELGLSKDFKIDNVVLAGSAVHSKSKLAKRLRKRLNQQGGRLLDGLADENGEGGYNLPTSQDAITGIGGRTKLGTIGRLFKTIFQIFKVGTDNHPHLKAAGDPNFGKTLIKQSLIDDRIEGEEGAYGAKNYLKSKSKEQDKEPNGG